MTLAITTSDYETYVNKEKSVQALLTAGKNAKFYMVKVVFGAGDNYVTGGVSADLSAGIQIDGYIAVIPEFTSIGVEVAYDKTAKKIKLYVATASPDSSKALSELVNGSTLTQNATFTFLVIEV